MRARFVIFFILIIVEYGSVLAQSHTQFYEVEVMDMNGTDGYFYFSYETIKKSSSNQSKLNFINNRISEELVEIADQHSIYDLVHLIDSIGPRIEHRLNTKLQVKDIKVLKIGVIEFIRNYVEKNGVYDDRIITIESSEIKNEFNYFDLRTDEKTRSNDLSTTLKSKYGSEVLVEFNIYFRKQVTPNLPIDSLPHHFHNTIESSLKHFELYDMWVSEKDSMEVIMKDIIKTHYPEISRVAIFNVVIPKEAEEHFKEITKKRHAIIEELFQNGNKINVLKKKLESENGLKDSEIDEIEEEMKKLREKRDEIKERGKSLTYKYKP